jgi:hypothetical protein
MGKRGVMPISAAVWAPHLLAALWCVRMLRRRM